MEKKERYNKPYLFSDGGNVPYAAFLEYDYKVRKTDYIIFRLGHTLPFDMNNPNMLCTRQDPSEYDLLFDTEITEEKLLTYGSLPNRMESLVIRKDVLELLLDLCPGDFQYFPITIRGIHKKIHYYENHDYVLLNLLNILSFKDCVDMDKTEFSYDKDGTILWIKRNLHLRNSECMMGHHVSHLKPAGGIIVSPEFRSLFKKHKIKGATFLKDREAYP